MQLRLASALTLALLAFVAQHAAGDNTTAVAAVTAKAGNKTAGATAAQSMGIPVDAAALAANPELASVPVGPPPTDSSSFVLDQAFTGHINASGVTGERRQQCGGHIDWLVTAAPQWQRLGLSAEAHS